MIKKKAASRIRLHLAIYRGFVEDNICISNAQYYELSAQQNLWCEILEF